MGECAPKRGGSQREGVMGDVAALGGEWHDAVLMSVLAHEQRAAERSRLRHGSVRVLAPVGVDR